jgi:hypothetical protein
MPFHRRPVGQPVRPICRTCGGLVRLIWIRPDHQADDSSELECTACRAVFEINLRPDNNGYPDSGKRI